MHTAVAAATHTRPQARLGIELELHQRIISTFSDRPLQRGVEPALRHRAAASGQNRFRQAIGLARERRCVSIGRWGIPVSLALGMRRAWKREIGAPDSPRAVAVILPRRAWALARNPDPPSNSADPSASRRVGDEPRASRAAEELRADGPIRQFETEAERQYKAAEIGGYCHLSSGQEAATVGSVARPAQGRPARHRLSLPRLRAGARRPGRGGDGRAVRTSDGCAHGRGGSMHLLDVERGFLRWLGDRRRPAADRDRPRARAWCASNVRSAVLCELGDGAVNMGAWHESLNLAARLAAAGRVPGHQQRLRDGHERRAGLSRARALPPRRRLRPAGRARRRRRHARGRSRPRARLLTRAREERRPAVLELLTYRYRGHSVADAGLAYRTRGRDRRAHQARDPIVRVRELLSEQGVADDGARRMSREPRAS